MKCNLYWWAKNLHIFIGNKLQPNTNKHARTSQRYCYYCKIQSFKIRKSTAKRRFQRPNCKKTFVRELWASLYAGSPERCFMKISTETLTNVLKNICNKLYLSMRITSWIASSHSGYLYRYPKWIAWVTRSVIFADLQKARHFPSTFSQQICFSKFVS